MSNKLESIKNSEVFKDIISDSCGGIMYDVANANKYDDKEILELWESMTSSEKESAGGIVKGAMEFLTDNKKEQKYIIISPDGFPISPDATHTEDEIEKAKQDYADCFKGQGYYSNSNRERIPLDEIVSLMSHEKI